MPITPADIFFFQHYRYHFAWFDYASHDADALTQPFHAAIYADYAMPP